MSFSRDRDLLMYEPNVFSDVPVVSQQRVQVSDATISGTTLTTSSADFEAAGVEAGSVILVEGVAHEVLSRTDAHTLTVSLPRASSDGEPITPSSGANLAAVCRTFDPQARTVHEELMACIGIDADDSGSDLDEGTIVSRTVVARLEALGTLHRVYSAAISVTGDNTELLRKQQRYQRRFEEACRQANILIDLDDDGQADTCRRLGTVGLRRA